MLARLRCWIALVSLAGLACACSGANFSLRVLGARDAFVTDAHVLLLDPDEPICKLGELWAGTTDQTGYVHVQSEWCGPARLVVAKVGMQTYEQRIDACARGHQVVRMRPARLPAPPADACSVAAYGFVEAWVHEDWPAMQALLLHSEAFLEYRDMSPRLKPWAMRVDSTHTTASSCEVLIKLLDDTGCEMPWRVVLSLDHERWQVLTLTQECC